MAPDGAGMRLTQQFEPGSIENRRFQRGCTLGVDQCAGLEQPRHSPQRHRQQARIVGRIQEGEVKVPLGKLANGSAPIPGDDVQACAVQPKFQALQGLSGGSMMLDEHHLGGTARRAFESQSATAGKQIQDAGR